MLVMSLKPDMGAVNGVAPKRDQNEKRYRIYQKQTCREKKMKKWLRNFTDVDTKIIQAETKFALHEVKQPMRVQGAFKCDVNISKKTGQAEFIVIRGKGEPLLGRETAIKMVVLKIGDDIPAVTEIKQAVQQMYQKVFSRVCKLNTNQVTPIHTGASQ